MIERNEFYDGLLFWLKGWRFLFQHRSLLWIALLPFLIGSGAVAALLWVLSNYLPIWIQDIVNWTGLSSGILHALLYYPLLISAALLGFLSSLYVVYLFQALLASPFHAFLADRTLAKLQKKSDDARVWREWMNHTWRMLRASLFKTMGLLLVGIILLLLSFVPVLNLLALWGTLVVLAIDCMDYSHEALGFGLRRRLHYLSRHPKQYIGMSVGLGLTLFIPGLTLLVIPGAVVGAAKIVITKDEMT